MTKQGSSPLTGPLPAKALPAANAGAPEKRVEPLELFFDLVFVFAITQVTARLANDATGGGLVRGMLVLAAIWWAWGAYAWLTNEVDAGSAAVRGTIFAAMAAMLVCALAIPGAFEQDALTFAVAYLIVRVLHIGLFVVGAQHSGVRQAALSLAGSALLAPAVLLVSAFLDGPAQAALWGVALLIDYVGGALRGIGGWRLSPAHFAERHGLIIIIALGESIIAIGVGASGVSLRAGTIGAAVLGIVVVCALWWTYFDGSPEHAEERLRELGEGRLRNTAARDAFSFLHLPMVAGIVLLALGVKKAVRHDTEPLDAIPAIALGAGVTLFLAAHCAFRARLAQPGGIAGLAVVALLALVAVPVGYGVSALAALGVLAAVGVVLMLVGKRPALSGGSS
ncbi:MAG: hypothetical protein QOC98_1970 [Frankiaceae bacterium]|nr:hypothetical protein [Frankiaceae bacterium]